MSSSKTSRGRKEGRGGRGEKGRSAGHSLSASHLPGACRSRLTPHHDHASQLTSSHCYLRISVFQREKLRLREVSWLAQGHSAKQAAELEPRLGSSNQNPGLFPMPPTHFGEHRKQHTEVGVGPCTSGRQTTAQLSGVDGRRIRVCPGGAGDAGWSQSPAPWARNQKGKRALTRRRLLCNCRTVTHPSVLLLLCQ